MLRKYIVIYCRYSTDMQRADSCADQERQVRAALARPGVFGFEIVVIHDEAESGTRTDRDGFRQLRDMVARGEVAVLAVDDQSRLTRADNAFANIADATPKEKLGGPNARAIKASDGHAFAAPVGQFKPNNFGVHDMHGNGWEWCDEFDGKYSALPRERNALQTGNRGEGRPVLRRGSWGLPPAAGRSANRYLVCARRGRGSVTCHGAR